MRFSRSAPRPQFWGSKRDTSMLSKPLFQLLPVLLLSLVPATGLMGCDRILSIVQRSPEDKLIQQLRDNAEFNAYDDQLVQSFRQMGPSSVPKLLPLLQDNEPRVRSHAAYMLGELGDPAHAAVPSMIPLLKDPDDRVRWNTAVALGKMGDAAQPAVTALIKDLQDPNEEVRESAIDALAQMGPTAKSAIPALIATFKGNTEFSASAALSGIGTPAIPSLMQAVKDPNEAVRLGALQSLGGMGKGAKSIVPQIIPRLKDPSPKVQVQTAWALQSMGESPELILPVLMAKLKDPDPDVRTSSAATLGQLGQAATPAIPALITALNDPNPDVRSSSAATLGQLGQAATPAVPALITALNDPNPRSDSLARTKAAEALGQLGEIGALMTALQNKNPLVRWRAAYVLGKMGATAKPAIPALTIASQDPDESVQRRAKEALKRLNNAI
jgi:HEAT repeat protein